MATPSLAAYFGANAQVLTAQTQVDASAITPALVIYYGDFGDQGLSDPASFSNPDRVFAAIVRKIHNWTISDTTEDPGTEITAPTKSFTTRNGSQRLAWLFYVSFFTPDITSSVPDPDEVGVIPGTN